MLNKRIIPCLDVHAGRVVKGTNFLNLRDSGDPVELASRYDAEGADEVVFLDITASSDERHTMVDVVTRAAEQLFIPLTVGGGVRNADSARQLLRAGADKVSVNTAAVQRPELIQEISGAFGNQCVVCAIEPSTLPTATKCSCTVAALQQASMREPGHSKPWHWELVKFCSRQWIATAREKVLICN